MVHSQKAAEFYLLLSVTIVLECFRLFYLFACDSFGPFEWLRCDTNFKETELTVTKFSVYKNSVYVLRALENIFY